jgi:hypothetical protein
MAKAKQGGVAKGESHVMPDGTRMPGKTHPGSAPVPAPKGGPAKKAPARGKKG